MKRSYIFPFMFVGILLVPSYFYAQEEQEIQVEESAEVFLEDYSDEFQENFFEGLKQKGIQNYDRAINYLLECKRLQPDNVAVIHELAKLYFLDNNYTESLVYAVEAVSNTPDNYWYLYTLMTTLTKQGNTIQHVAEDIPMANVTLKEHLAKIYFGQKNYEEALSLVAGLERSKSVNILEQKINDAIALQKKDSTTVSYSTTGTVNNSTGTNELEAYKARISALLRMPSSSPLLLQLSEEALETYPAQPFFYYANGYALNKKGKHRNAIEVLETALDYMVSDISLANKIYTELGTAYNAISNPSKANIYLLKVKPGF